MAQFWWYGGDRVLVDDQGRPKWGDSAEDCCCPEGCPTDCPNCASPLSVAVSDFADPWTEANYTFSAIRFGCQWDASYPPWPPPDVVKVYNVKIRCQPKEGEFSPPDNLWHVVLVGHWQYDGNWYYPQWTSEGREGPCPPVGEYIMMDDNADAAIIGIPTVIVS